jgi:hypothetical protein
MCNPFFYEIQVVPPVNAFKVVCCIATMYSTEAEGWRIDPDRRLDQLSRRKRTCRGPWFV